MKLIVITSAEEIEEEHKKLISLFNAGMKNLHIRKPDYSAEKMSQYIRKIPSEYRKRIVLHSHHLLALKYGLKGIHLTEKHRSTLLAGAARYAFFKLLKPGIQISASYHSLKEVSGLGEKRYKYVLLSPVFPSISKDKEKTLNMSRVQDAIRATKSKIIALGGIEEDKVQKCHDVGFHGVAVLGAIWQSENPVTVYKSIRKLCKKQHHLLSALPALILQEALVFLPI